MSYFGLYNNNNKITLLSKEEKYPSVWDEIRLVRQSNTTEIVAFLLEKGMSEAEISRWFATPDEYFIFLEDFSKKYARGEILRKEVTFIVKDPVVKKIREIKIYKNGFLQKVLSTLSNPVRIEIEDVVSTEQTEWRFEIELFDTKYQDSQIVTRTIQYTEFYDEVRVMSFDSESEQKPFTVTENDDWTAFDISWIDDSIDLNYFSADELSINITNDNFVVEENITDDIVLVLIPYFKELASIKILGTLENVTVNFNQIENQFYDDLFWKCFVMKTAIPLNGRIIVKLKE